MDAKRIIAACGNDCSACPRFMPKSPEELTATAVLWEKIGYRDHVVSNEEIACTGCKETNWCRYNIVSCVKSHDISNCGQCPEYPCSTILECFKVTESFIPACREVCTSGEFATLKKAFFEKRENLS